MLLNDLFLNNWLNQLLIDNNICVKGKDNGSVTSVKCKFPLILTVP